MLNKTVMVKRLLHCVCDGSIDRVEHDRAERNVQSA
jgi:hypothetical protein